MPKSNITQTTVSKMNQDGWQDSEDSIAVEEPLEIRVNGIALAVIMRTPGNDMELAAGFLFTEGIIHSIRDIGLMNYCRSVPKESEQNIVNVYLKKSASFEPDKYKRNFYASSSCGLCGKASIEAIRTMVPEPVEDPLAICPEILSGLHEKFHSKQSVFHQTGGLHAAALFNSEGNLIALREDVGRHNAVDKVIGYALRERMVPLRQTILMVSGRASFEITQKAAMAQIPMIAAVSAPSSLAIELASECHMTLIGFLRNGRMNVYTGKDRILTKV